MELINFTKVKDGKYLKNYELTYRNKAGREKVYEMVSRRELKKIEDIGSRPSGVSIVATCEDKLRFFMSSEWESTVLFTIYAPECWNRKNP